MDEIKRPLFVIALIALTLAVGLELGSSALIAPAEVTRDTFARTLAEQGYSAGEISDALANFGAIDSDDPPGVAITSLAVLDGLLLLSMAGLGAALVFPHRVLARIVAPVNLVVSLLLIIIGIIVTIVLIALLFLMIGLFLAAPFGTIAYLARWGFFPRGEAQFALGLILFCKLVFCGFAVAASPRLVTQKGLVAMVITSLLLQLVVGFLHALVPLPLVSIIDVLAAIIVMVVGIVWAVVILVGSLIGTIRLIKFRT